MNADISETINYREFGLQIKDSVALYAPQVCFANMSRPQAA